MSVEENKDIFNKALRRFTMDMAVDKAIKKLHDQGHSPEEIKDKLDFPVSVEYIRGKIDEFDKQSEEEPVFERAYTEYGKPYFIKKRKEDR